MRPSMFGLISIAASAVALQAFTIIIAVFLANAHSQSRFVEASDGSLAVADRWGITILAEVRSEWLESGWSRTTVISAQVGYPVRWLGLSGSKTESGTFPSDLLPPGPLYRRKHYLITTVRPTGVDLGSLAMNSLITYCCISATTYGFVLVRAKIRLRHERCPMCGYDRTATTDSICPECGS